MHTPSFPTASHASDAPVRLTAVSGGMGEPSLTTRLSTRLHDAARRELEAHGLDVETAQVPLRPLATAVAQAHLGTVREPHLDRALDTVLASDALVVVAPTYKASMAGMARAFWELVEDGALRGVPVLLAATGGTARHSLVLDTSLRPLFAQLGATALPHGVFAATDDWGGGPAAADGAGALDVRIAGAGADLAHAVLRERAAPRPPEASVRLPPADMPTAQAPSPTETPFAAILGRP